MPEGASLNQTEKVIEKLSGAVQQLDGVESVMGIPGFDIMAFSGKSSAGAMFVGLNGWEDRTTAETQINAIINKTFGVGAKVAPEARVISFNIPAFPGLGTVGGCQI